MDRMVGSVGQHATQGHSSKLAGLANMAPVAQTKLSLWGRAAKRRDREPKGLPVITMPAMSTYVGRIYIRISCGRATGACIHDGYRGLGYLGRYTDDSACAEPATDSRYVCAAHEFEPDQALVQGLNRKRCLRVSPTEKHIKIRMYQMRAIHTL
jgi:hypothetical protein